MPPKPRIAALLPLLLLGACNTLDRLSEVGGPPRLSQIENPVHKPDYQPVSLPMPRPELAQREANSLWRPGARAFFKDQRATRIGDILTVSISIADEAKLDNATTRTRNNSEDADATSILGYEAAGNIAQVLPGAVNPAQLVSFGSATSNAGKGTVNRKEEVKLSVAAIVTQILPNGNLVISGNQEVRVNFETRILTVSGVVRPEDITATNIVNHTQIAEARISYGGRGQLTDVQQPRYGQQLFDIVFPF
jgi:flagellar L-ring protein precursor FlgH